MPNSIIYSVNNSSRYPSEINLKPKKASGYPEKLKKEIDFIKTSPKVKEVYVFETDKKLELFEGAPPKIKLNRGTQTLAEKISVPTREMKETKIMYNL